ncbi:MAG: sulfite exporter TauE/SafE family protein [Deltaproteobacteria bacterium]|nr:sulfite exporter TauE/SafE family protein [Deltaproteobacteria bacterium]
MLALAIASSVLMGVVLGLLGGGGSILTTPILLYLLRMDPKEAIASSLLVVGITSFAALVPRALARDVDFKTGGLFGAATMAGAFVGGLAAGYIPAKILLSLFALMMVAAAWAMFRGPSGVSDPAHRPGHRPTALTTALQGLGVGAVTGLVGAGGGFLIVPALTFLGGLPMKRAVGTSLFVIALNSVAGFLGHAMHVTIHPWIIAVVAAAAVLGSFAGSALSSRVPATLLRRSFASLALLMAAVIVFRQS